MAFLDRLFRQFWIDYYTDLSTNMLTEEEDFIIKNMDTKKSPHWKKGHKDHIKIEINNKEEVEYKRLYI